MLFTNKLEGAFSALVRYDMLRDAVYRAGLPVLEEDIEALFQDYEDTGELPDELREYLDNEPNEHG